MRTTVSIDDELLAQAKLLAVRTHRTIGSVLEDALRKLIADQAALGEQAPFSLPVLSYDTPGVRPGVDLLDKEQMADLSGENEPRALP